LGSSIDLPDEETASQYPIVVLFLDEMNSAAGNVQAAAYQLILNRRVGKYKLARQCCYGGRRQQRERQRRYLSYAYSACQSFHPPRDESGLCQLPRVGCSNKIHKDVVGYLSFAKQDLYDFDAKSASRAFATPRSWTFVSQLLDDEDTDNDTLTNLIAGTVVKALLLSLWLIARLPARCPSPLGYLKGKVKDLNVKEVSAMYSLVISMCYELKDAVENKTARQRVPRHGRQLPGLHDEEL
jgi:hypothetical protein